MNNEKQDILMSFSGGRSSALAMRVLTLDGVPDNFHIVFANTGKEKNETLDFVHECETRWNLPIVWVEGVYNQYDLEKEYMVSSIGFRIVTYETAKRTTDKDTPFEKMIEWVNCGIVPNRMSRFCTKYLKIVPMERYLQSIGVNSWQVVMGIRFDEPNRVKKHPLALMPLVGAKITQEMVRQWWDKQPFDLKLKDYEGNCDLCHLKTRKKKMTIIKEHPEVADWWSEMEKKTNSTFEHKISIDDFIIKSKSKKFQPIKDKHETGAIENSLFDGIDLDDIEINCFCGD